MEFLHCTLNVIAQQVGQYRQCGIYRLIDQCTIRCRGTLQHVIGYVARVSRVRPSDTQPVEVVTSQLLDQVPQAIMAAMAAVPL